MSVETVPARTQARRPRWWRRHRILSGLLGVGLVLTLVAAPSLIPALTRPGTDSLAARVAEWARTHGFSSIIDFAERIRYDLNPPQVGGTPRNGLPSLLAIPVAPARTRDPRALPLPAPIPPLATPALPGEGSWHVVAGVAALPAMAVAFVRPDTVHTSYVSGLVWMDPKLLVFALHPGLEDPPPGQWGQPDTLPPGQRHGLLAAFNSGFRLYASQGGYYAYGHAYGALRTGAASIVIYRNGTATVGQWGRDVTMGADVVAVRQNLDLIVDGGRPVPGLDQNVQQRWGATLGNKFYVYRTGIGVTADGALVYAAGNSLSVSTLAQLFVRAGCVRAMELDINPAWASFVLYDGAGDPASPSPRNLLPDMQEPPNRYYQPVSRDFFSVYSGA
ncbi:MAG TPA: phosphodiester glycosidase family protein [Mycobacteriales bacterium]|nr:phosphodiester glycosidase family protein [Mycobacteriales bacterium]